MICRAGSWSSASLVLGLLGWLPVGALSSGCWLSHRAPEDAAVADAPERPSCARCDCAVGEVCVVGVCRAPHATTTWARSFGSPLAAATGVAFDAAGALGVGGYVVRSGDVGLGPFVAGTSGDAIVVLLEPDGAPRWARTFPGDAAQVTEVAFDGPRLWAAGVFGRSVTVLDRRLTSGAVPDAFVAHLGPAAEPLAVLGLAGGSDDRILAILPLGADAFVAGYYAGSATLGTSALPAATGIEAMVGATRGGGVAWARLLTELGARVVNAAAVMPGGDVVVSGLYDDRDGSSHLPPSTGSSDTFVARLDVDGDIVWARGLGGAGEDIAHSVAADAAGNVYATYSVSEGSRVGDLVLEGAGTILARLDGGGAVLWARAVSRGIGPEADIGVDPMGNALVLVSFEGTSSADGVAPITAAGGYDMLVVTYGADGDALESVRIGGAGNDWPGGIATDGCGAFAVVGAYEGELPTDAGTLTSAGSDGFVTHWIQ
jgi:hypothetical protein